MINFSTKNYNRYGFSLLRDDQFTNQLKTWELHFPSGILKYDHPKPKVALIVQARMDLADFKKSMMDLKGEPLVEGF